MNDANTLFKEHVQRSILHVLKRISSTARPVESDLGLVQHILIYALDIPQAWLTVRTLILAVAPQMEQAGYRDEWIDYLEKAINLSRNAKDTEAEAELTLQKGRIHQLRGNFDTARSCFEASCQLFETLGHATGLARALNRVAFICCMTEQFDTSIALSHRALNLLADDDPNRAAHYNVLGRVAYLTRDWSTATHYYTKALTIRERQDDKRLVGYNLRDLSAALGEQGRIEEAIHCCQKSIVLLGEVGDPIQQATCRINLGTLYLTEQPIKALACFEFVKPLFHKIRDELNLAIIYTNIGVAHRLSGEWWQAERALQTAIGYWTPLNRGFFLLNAWEELGVTQMQQGKSEAIATFKQALEMMSKLSETPSLLHLKNKLLMHLAEAQMKLEGSSS